MNGYDEYRKERNRVYRESLGLSSTLAHALAGRDAAEFMLRRGDITPEVFMTLFPYDYDERYE
jgi:hypothetical protein